MPHGPRLCRHGALHRVLSVPLLFDAERMHRGIVPIPGMESRRATWASCADTGWQGCALDRDADSRGQPHTGSFDEAGSFTSTGISPSNPYVVIPNRAFFYDAEGGTSYLHRISFDLNKPTATVEIEKLYSLIAPLPRRTIATTPCRTGTDSWLPVG